MAPSGHTSEKRTVHSKITKKFKTESGQLVFHHGHGGEVQATDGTTYLDFVMGYGPVVLGHNTTSFTRAVAESLTNGVMMPGYTSFHEEYLDRLLADQPGRRGAFFKTASEAVTAALRLAAIETERRGVIRCGFIGWHDAQIADSLKWHDPLASPLRYKQKYTENMRGVGDSEPVLNWHDLSLETLEELIDTHRSTVGCLVIDAYQASMTTPELMRRAVDLARNAGLLTVFDETKTGGRISRLGYAADHGIDTDLIVIGKALANGAPLSMLVGSTEHLATAEKSRLSGTFSKEMLAVYAALATLDELETPRGEFADGWAELGAVGSQVASCIAAAAREAGAETLVSAQPVMGGAMFELTYAERLLGDRASRDALLDSFTDAGILLLEGHPSFVCGAHRDNDWDELTRRSAKAFTQWLTTTGGIGK
ncbi:aminotransferase class III-fold pyridoxal phosphate-dependent enzyme [Allosaccharopolyspora coralli]|uniref:aminotransferase class III-fold pyridoxal phosphate-dependent enzyme n=1 Tax=Allosaccharopolyspora coralli TaxID=2665642 RepID=UPI001652B1B6|nr:aminotransferase class III-fold pyridoxal phosphate-dependent enzyme [Allosaccharopolyspora coralli]